MAVHRIPNTDSATVRVGVRVLWLIAMAVALNFTTASSANPRYDAWQARHPYTLSAWNTHDKGGGGELDLDYFLASGLNTAWGGRCSYNSQRPFADLKGLPTIYTVYADRQPDLEGFIADLNKAREHYPNIIALLLGDEVAGDDAFTHYRQIRDWVVNNKDPKISSLLTITSVPAGKRVSGSKGIQDAWTHTCERIQPDVLLAQFYPGRSGNTVEGAFYSSLEWYFNWAKKMDVGMWCWNRAWSSGPPLPSESLLRVQRYANLAYGVRGMADFLWIADSSPTIKDGGYWNINGPNPTILYKRLAPINHEIARLGPTMLKLTPVRVYHMDSRDDGDGVHHFSDSDADLPTWMRRTGLLANVTGAANRNHVMVGFFRDDAGQEYFMVVNKDIGPGPGADLATPIQLTFHPSVTGLQRLNRQTGEVENIAVRSGNYVWSLPGGTGDLFKFNNGTGFAGVEEVVRPRLVSAKPASGGTLPRLLNNVLRFTFDRDATQVRAEIRQVGTDGELLAGDLAEKFTCELSKNKRTITYRENGSVLKDGCEYRVVLHWAQAVPMTLYAVRGDVNGDKQRTTADVELVQAQAGSSDGLSRADMNGDGVVDRNDYQLVDGMVNIPQIDWSESFEDYSEGPLAGQGGWLEPQTLPGTVLNRAWVNGSAVVSTEAGPLDGPHKASPPGGMYWGNEIKFAESGGLGGVGVVRFGFVVRLGNRDFQNPGVHLWNSSDTEGKLGGFSVEVTSSGVQIRGSRGIELSGGSSSVTTAGGIGPDSKGLAVDIEVDFGTNILTWQCRNRDNDKLYGPFEVPFTGTALGIDGLSFFMRGPGSQIDSIYVRNF